MIYYTADLHFGHKKVLKMDGRPFDTIEEHDEYLINSWNARVRPEDEVYILGDFCLYAKKSPADYLKRLSGKKHLIVGNHDHLLLKDPEAMAQFETVEHLCCIQDGDKRVVLCHYPLAEWHQYYRGSWHIYGHIHNNRKRAFDFLSREERALNAGVMINQYQPVTLPELIANKRSFQDNDEEYRSVFGDRKIPMELENELWICEDPLSGKLETGGIDYILSEYASKGLIYHYCINGERTHEHSFDAVLRDAFYNADSFEIPEEDRAEYSAQQLEWLEVLVAKLRQDSTDEDRKWEEDD